MAKKKISDAILFALEKAIDGYVYMEDFVYNTHMHIYGMREVKKSSMASALARLREKGYIDKEKFEKRLIIKLTETGKDWIMKNKSDGEIEWDGIWRLVIFDIPEAHKGVRNVLRRRLKIWGFSAWQKSVWASKKPLTGQIRKLVKDLGVEEWVLVIESANADIGK